MTEPGGSRLLTDGEKRLAASMYGDRIDLSEVQICRRKWWPFQPRDVVMAPSGHIHFHEKSDTWREDYSEAHVTLQGLLIHELCHVWQRQKGIYLPLARHPFCRYHYRFTPGWPLRRYGIEQQAEIVRHAFMLKQGYAVPGAPPLAQYESLLLEFAGK